MFLPYVYKKIKSGKSCNRWLALIFFTLYFSLINLLIVKNAYPAEATLSWTAPTTNADGSPLTDLAGYKIYYGTASGNYTMQINVGNVLTYRINTLSEGFTYYFVTTAYDTSGNESGYSNEVSKTIPSTTQFTLTSTKSGTGTGTVTSSPTGINCGTDCSEPYASGTTVTLTASAGTGSTFTGWGSGCSVTTGNTCITTMNANKTITATFNRITYTLTVTKSGTGSGTVTSTPSGINCGTDCTENYIANTVVTLTATPATGSTFTGWSGGGCSGTGTCVVTMSSARSITATFATSAASTTSDFTIPLLTGPKTAIPGSSITIADTIKNQGAGTTIPSTTKFYWSTNSAYDAGDIYLGQRAVPSLASGATDTGSTSIIVPADAYSGTFYIIAKADADNVVLETNENNNIRAISIKTGMDLKVTILTAPALSGAEGEITITDTTKNNGRGRSAASRTKFYLSIDGFLDSADTELCNRVIPELAAYEASTGTISVTIPSGTATGTYYIIAKADADNVVPEINENNNVRYKTIRIGPDLRVYTLSAPASAGSGTEIIITDTTKNNGGGAAGSYTTNYYLSKDRILDPAADILLGRRVAAGLGSGESSMGTISVTIPSGTAAGTYYIIAKADADNVVSELNEGNNVKFRHIKIGANLVVYSLGAPVTAGSGTEIIIADTTKNNGPGSSTMSTTKYYFSSDRILDPGDILLGSRVIAGLGSGEISMETISVTIPSGTAAGTYYIIAKADADNVVPEINEGDNVKFRTITITQ